MIPENRIIAILSPESAPVKRMIQAYRDDNKLIDGTQGRKTKSVIFLEAGYIALSYLTPETLAGKLDKEGS